MLNNDEAARKMAETTYKRIRPRTSKHSSMNKYQSKEEIASAAASFSSTGNKYRNVASKFKTID